MKLELQTLIDDVNEAVCLQVQKAELYGNAGKCQKHDGIIDGLGEETGTKMEAVDESLQAGKVFLDLSDDCKKNRSCETERFSFALHEKAIEETMSARMHARGKLINELVLIHNLEKWCSVKMFAVTILAISYLSGT